MRTLLRGISPTHKKSLLLMSTQVGFDWYKPLGLVTVELDCNQRQLNLENIRGFDASSSLALNERVKPNSWAQGGYDIQEL